MPNKKPSELTSSDEIALYIHWPFCISRCPYCDFNAHVRPNIEQPDWGKALLSELEYWAKNTPKRKIKSIFFGGGTPSLMEPSIAADIIDKASKLWTLENETEITFEANPTSVEIKNFREFRSAGLNRVSIGLQALDDNALKFLGRKHSRKVGILAIELANKIFPRYSFDLIYGRPQQTTTDWKSELHEAIQMAAGHLSLYQLTIEKGTPFYAEAKSGTLMLPDEEVSSMLFQITQDICEQKGLLSYEISNHARPGQECIHNLTYWTGGDYIGVGPGAHGRITIGNETYETEQAPGPETWFAAVRKKGHATRKYKKINLNARIDEILLMGLRLTNGISREHFIKRTGVEFEDALNPKRLRPLLVEDYLVLDEKGLRATKKGLLRLNSVLAAMLS